MAKYQRDPDEARKKFETPFLNEQSKHLSKLDAKNNAAPHPFRPKLETQHPKSAAFERRLNGG